MGCKAVYVNDVIKNWNCVKCPSGGVFFAPFHYNLNGIKGFWGPGL